MIENLLSNNYLFDYGIVIGSGVILGCSVYYLIRGNNTVNLPNNTEALITQEIEAIDNENKVHNSNIIDSLTESESEIETDYDNISDYENADIADFDEILKDPDLYFLPPFDPKFRTVEFIMPDVDFDVCSIEELKLYEFCSLFSKEMDEHDITEEDMMEIICMFPKEELATNWINDLLLAIVKLL